MQILAKLEVSLATVSGRPTRAHIAAALAARWPYVIPAVLAFLGLPILAGLLTSPLTLAFSAVAGGLAAYVGHIVWRDSTKRAAGD